VRRFSLSSRFNRNRSLRSRTAAERRATLKTDGSGCAGRARRRSRQNTAKPQATVSPLPLRRAKWMCPHPSGGRTVKRFVLAAVLVAALGSSAAAQPNPALVPGPIPPPPTYSGPPDRDPVPQERRRDRRHQRLLPLRYRRLAARWHRRRDPAERGVHDGLPRRELPRDAGLRTAPPAARVAVPPQEVTPNRSAETQNRRALPGGFTFLKRARAARGYTVVFPAPHSKGDTAMIPRRDLAPVASSWRSRFRTARSRAATGRRGADDPLPPIKVGVIGLDNYQASRSPNCGTTRRRRRTSAG